MSRSWHERRLWGPIDAISLDVGHGQGRPETFGLGWTIVQINPWGEGRKLCIYTNNPPKEVM